MENQIYCTIEKKNKLTNMNDDDDDDDDETFTNIS
jgi:hypothetical protein